MDTNEIIEFDALYTSMCKCRHNVSWKGSVQSFLLNDIDKICDLSEALQNGTYKEKPQKQFKIFEPKERDITSLAFVDRIYQRSLNDNLIYPQMTRSLIYDNVACQKDKGTDFGRERLKCHLQKYWRKHGCNGYVLQIDVKGYYPNMSHQAVKDKFKRHLDPQAYAMAEVILDGFEGDIGYYAGSQIIQIAGITLLDDADHYAKEQLHIKHYLRYMDDTIILAETKEQAQQWLDALEKEYAKVDCGINRKKTKIYSLKHKITFLGFDFRLTQSGRVTQVVNNKKLRCKKNKYRKMLYIMYYPRPNKKKVDNIKFNECVTAFTSHISKGNSYNVLNNFNAYIAERKDNYVQKFNS